MVEVAAGRDYGLELCRRDRQAGNNITNTACLLIEVPHKLAPGGLLRVALTVLRVDRDARTEERHLVRRNNRHTLHQFQHLGWVVSANRGIPLATQYGKATLDDAIRGVVRRAPRPRRRVFPTTREGWARILCFEPVHHRLDTLNVLIPDVVLAAELRRNVNMGDVVAGRRIDTVECLEEEPFLPQIGRNLVQACLSIADKAVGELALIVAGIGMVEASGAFQDGLAAHVPLLR